MKFSHTQVFNLEGAFRGLRNPLESWDRSDSMFGLSDLYDKDTDYEAVARWTEEIDHSDFDKDYDLWEAQNEKYLEWLHKNGILKYDNRLDLYEYAFLGPKDIDLAHRMIKAGTSDSKFLRQIFISVDITAPLYWWKQADTYKIATVANSTSTMHKLASTPITIDCFETDDWNKDFDQIIPDDLIPQLEILRQKYLETKDKRYWKELIRWLPEGWLQTRTWTANYAVLRNIYFQRKHHKLTEWHTFCQWIESLPYAADLITYE